MFLEFYQHLPERFDPVAFSIGPIAIHWYALMYIIAFGIVFFLLRWRIQNGEFAVVDPSTKKTTARQFVEDLLLWGMVGVLLGGRIGYVLFYGFDSFLSNPLSLVSPFSASGEWIGISGMSYHGGLIGALIACGLFVRRNNMKFLDVADFVIPAVPLAYTFGRIGNFVNGELYGRVTDSAWGMYFPLAERLDGMPLLRHPSQLYEAVLEGVVLFIILWSIRSKRMFRGQLLALYIIGYALARFGVEFFREPDAHLGFVAGLFSMGQLLSLGMLLIGLIVYRFWRKRSVKT